MVPPVDARARGEGAASDHTSPWRGCRRRPREPVARELLAARAGSEGAGCRQWPHEPSASLRVPLVAARARGEGAAGRRTRPR